MPQDLIFILLFVVLGSGLALGLVGINKILAPTRVVERKLEPYECGEVVIGTPWVKTKMRYYIFALLFLIFDIETVFLFPWAVAFKQLGLFGLVEMFIFILLLFLGLLYPWRKGVLEWV